MFSLTQLKPFSAFLVSILTTSIAIASDPTTQTGIPLDVEWKKKLYEFASQHVKHSAWGIAHSERNYHASITLAEQEGIQIDKDVIFAAALLHDIGAIEPFKQKDIEHSIRSVEIAEPLLDSYGFPTQKWPKVKAAILGHMYYATKPTEKDAILFHDADALDFFGTIGIIRLVSLTEKHMWAPSLAGAFVTLHKFQKEVPGALVTNTAKAMAAQSILKMEEFISSLDKETFEGKAL